MAETYIDQLFQQCDPVYRFCVIFNEFTGERNALLIDHAKSELKVIGGNTCGKLATGDDKPHDSIFSVKVNFDVNQINELIEGSGCMFATLKTTGIYVWGTNLFGLFGNGQFEDRKVKPQKISYFDDKKIIKLSVGNNHQICLDDHGNLFGWGDNRHKQVLDNDNATVETPTPINPFRGRKFRDIICMSNTSIAIDLNYRVYIWGVNQWEFNDEIQGTMISSPTWIKIDDKVECISCSTDSFYYKNRKKELYKFNGFQGKRFESFKNIHYLIDDLLFDVYSNNVLFIKNKQVYHHENEKLKKVAENLFEYFECNYQATYNTYLIDKIKVKYYTIEGKTNLAHGFEQKWIEMVELEPEETTSVKFQEEAKEKLINTPLRHSPRLGKHTSPHKSEKIDRMKDYGIDRLKSRKMRKLK